MSTDTSQKAPEKLNLGNMQTGLAGAEIIGRESRKDPLPGFTSEKLALFYQQLSHSHLTDGFRPTLQRAETTFQQSSCFLLCVELSWIEAISV